MGQVICEDDFIVDDITCRLDCQDGYSGGGQDINKCMENGNWTVTPDFQCTKVASVGAEGVFILGGTGGGKSLLKASFFAPSDAAAESTCLRGLASMSGTPRTKVGAAQVDSDIVVCGGVSADKDDLKTCEIYDPAVDNWVSMVDAMKYKRVSPAVVYYDGKLMVLGGYGDNAILSVTTEKYDALSKWTLGVDLPNRQLLRGHCALVIDNQLYLIGGYANTYTGFTYVLDGTTWKDLDQMYINRERHACAYVDFPEDKGILVSGGLTGDALQTTEFYSLNTERWRILANMNTPRYGHGLAQIRGQIIAFGGINQNSTEVYNPSLDTWKLSPDTLEIDNFQFGHVAAKTCLKPE
jgi:hypothetical protein